VIALTIVCINVTPECFRPLNVVVYIVLGPRPRTFGVTPAIFAKQYSEHVQNGHFFGRLIGTAVVTVCIKLPPQWFRPLDMIV
jgi:hypothetical protein